MPLRLIWVAVLAIVAATVAAMAYVSEASTLDTYERFRRTHTVRVGFAVEAPYAYIEPSGEVTGEAAEIARRILQDMGAQRIEWVRMNFARLIPDLLVGRIDVIAAGMFITPEREREVLFSGPTMEVNLAFVVRQGNPRRLQNFEDLLQDDEKRLAAIRGSVEARQAEELGVPEAQILAVATAEQGLSAVEHDVASAFAISEATAAYLANTTQHDDIRVVRLSGTPVGRPAFAFRRSDAALRDAFDARLRCFLGTAEHRQLVARFGLRSEAAIVMGRSC